MGVCNFGNNILINVQKCWRENLCFLSQNFPNLNIIWNPVCTIQLPILWKPWTRPFKRNTITETSITVKVSRKTRKVEIHLVKEGSGLAFSSMEVGHNFRCIGCNDSGALLRGKWPHKPEFAHDIVRIHSLMIYADLIEYKTIGDTEAPLLRCFPVIWKLKAGVTITTGQCMSYQTFSNLQFRWLLESSFHSIHINLRDERRKIHFVSVGTTRLVLMFKKASKIHF